MRIYFETPGKAFQSNFLAAKAARGMQSCSDSGLKNSSYCIGHLYFLDFFAIILKQRKVVGLKKLMPFVKNKLNSFKFTLKCENFIGLGQYAKKLNASHLLLRKNIILSIYKLNVLFIGIFLWLRMMNIRGHYIWFFSFAI